MPTSIRSVAGLAIGVAIACQILWAQRPGGMPSNSSGTGGNRLPPSMNGLSNTSVPGSLNGNVYLTGNVLMDDGTPPPGPVTIERVCGGAPRAQAYTDLRGRFSFQIGQTAGVTQDASEEGAGLPGAPRPATSIASGTGPAQQATNAPDMLANCDLRAVLAGFRSDLVSLGGRHLLDDPNVGTIMLHRLANVEGTAVSMASLQAPKEARRAYGKAQQDLRRNKSEEAAKELLKAVEIYPKYAAAWYELGRIQEQRRDAGQARNSYAQAMAADSKFISPYLAVAELEAKAENWAALADVTSRLLKLDAVDYPMAYFYNATANLLRGRIDAAETSARAGEKLDPSHRYPRMEQVLGAILARKKDYAGAAAHLRIYLALEPDAEEAARTRKELAEMDRLSGANEQAKAAAVQP
jgi:tetratricopeptide (TPR) repeat protein